MKCIILFLFVFVLFLQNSYAFKLSPMIEEIELQSKNNRTQFYIENDQGDQKIAVQLKVLTREMKLDGTESQNPTTQFSVYPTQVILNPKEKRGIKITYTGPTNLEKEEAFRVVAEQLPVTNLNNGTNTGIKILLKYVGALYLVPEKAKAKIKIDKVKIESNMLEISLSNSGTKHQVLRNIVLKLKTKNKQFEFKDDSLEGLTGENILAKSIRHFTIKWPVEKLSDPIFIESIIDVKE